MRSGIGSHETHIVFCLAEGPSEEAAVAVHAEAHGRLPSAVIELDPTAPLNALLGPLPAYPVGTAYSEPAMRGVAEAGDITVSIAVRELCRGKRFTFVEREPVPLKRLPEPVNVFAFDWRD